MGNRLKSTLPFSSAEGNEQLDCRLQMAAERVFGTQFDSFSRISTGNSSLNFNAVEHNGRRHLVKFFTGIARLRLEMLSQVTGNLVPKISLGNGSLPIGNDWHVCALEWREGESVDPANITEAQISSLYHAHKELCQALKGTACPAADSALSSFCAGLTLCPIHGDMHFKNVFFEGDKATSFFDLEKIRLGLPTEDLLRYFIHAPERTRFWRLRRTSAIKRNFASLVHISEHPTAAWLAALDLYEKRKMERRARKARSRIAFAIDCFMRSGLYGSFRRIIVKGDRAP